MRAGTPYGRRYTVEEARAESPRFRAAFTQYGNQRGSNFLIPAGTDAIWDHWHESSRQNSALVWDDSTNRYQRKFIDSEAVAKHEAEQNRLHAKALATAHRQATENALAEPTVKYALMPKLEEIQGLLADETHAKILGIAHANDVMRDEHIPHIKTLLSLISNNVDSANDRLDLSKSTTVEAVTNLQTVNEKIDEMMAEQKDLKSEVQELKSMFSELLLALKSPGLTSRN